MSEWEGKNKEHSLERGNHFASLVYVNLWRKFPTIATDTCFDSILYDLYWFGIVIVVVFTVFICLIMLIADMLIWKTIDSPTINLTLIRCLMITCLLLYCYSVIYQLRPILVLLKTDINCMQQFVMAFCIICCFKIPLLKFSFFKLLEIEDIH